MGAYELSKIVTSPKFGSAGHSGSAEGILAAYGPWWHDFRASLSIEGSGPAARGMVFRLNDEGCHVLLLSGTGQAKAVAPARTDGGITVECSGDRITILVNGVQVERVNDPSFTDGYVGMAQYGYGRTFFRDLRVEGLP